MFVLIPNRASEVQIILKNNADNLIELIKEYKPPADDEDFPKVQKAIVSKLKHLKKHWSV